MAIHPEQLTPDDKSEEDIDSAVEDTFVASDPSAASVVTKTGSNQSTGVAQTSGDSDVPDTEPDEDVPDEETPAEPSPGDEPSGQARSREPSPGFDQ